MLYPAWLCPISWKDLASSKTSLNPWGKKIVSLADWLPAKIVRIYHYCNIRVRYNWILVKQIRFFLNLTWGCYFRVFLNILLVWVWVFFEACSSIMLLSDTAMWLICVILKTFFHMPYNQYISNVYTKDFITISQQT